MPRTARILFLHHSTGAAIWAGGLADSLARWNRDHGTAYAITEEPYPATTGALPAGAARWLPYRVIHALSPHYPWANYPYDYWNLWVARRGADRDRGEANLDDLVRGHDVLVFKHCFPVSDVRPDGPSADVASPERTAANYRLQYLALRERLREFPEKRFILWTGPALTEAETDPETARRAQAFFAWVRDEWDEPGDNVFLWDFRALETEGGLYLLPENAAGPSNAHPGAAFSRRVAPLLGRRIVDVIEGRGDTRPITGVAGSASVPAQPPPAALGR